MLVSPRTGRCPRCSYEGYCYDSVCRVWCCGQCHMMETEAEKRRREMRVARVRPTPAQHRQTASIRAVDRKEAVASAARRVA